MYEQKLKARCKYAG